VKPRIVDVDLENLHLTPKECRRSVFWELDDEDLDLDPFFQKEEWFSSTLLEWGRCGKLAVEVDDGLAFSQYAPPTLFPRLQRFRTGRVSADAAYLSYCYVVEGRRRRGLGAQLVRAVARDVVERGYLALEAIGDREWNGDWVLPHDYLYRVGFRVLYEDARYPLMRLDLMAREPMAVATERVELPLPVTAQVPALEPF
jgi:GNAT superfamily N-acetyltransferase